MTSHADLAPNTALWGVRSAVGRGGRTALFLTLLAGFALPARAVEPGLATVQGPPLAEDPLLKELLAQAMKLRPELARAQVLVTAERERVPQVGALPDPTLSFGIQNDGFSEIAVGKMETSWLFLMASQTLPWFGKRGLRSGVVEAQVRQTEAGLARAQLDVQAEVRTAYIELLSVRDRMRLLARLETLWAQAEALARSRYEAGEGAQSDQLRAQLERTRLRQRRWALEADERRAREALNRLRGHRLDEPIETSRSVTDIPDPSLPDAAQLLSESEARSPELQSAKSSVLEAEQRVDLARRDYYPDVTVTAGIMPRWGGFETMWQAGLGFNLPVWAGRKQARAVAENRSRRTAAENQVEAIDQLLRQRISERLALMSASIESNRLYRTGLLVQSDATVSSTLAQYGVGKVPFASVLEALVGYVNDVDAFIGSVATTHQLAIALESVSLDPAGSIGGVGLGSSKMATGGPASSAGAAASSGAAGAVPEASGGGGISKM